MIKIETEFSCVEHMMELKEITVTILVEPDFVPTELSLVQDVLRIANRFSQSLNFRTQHCSTSGLNIIEGLGGVLVKAKAFIDITNEVPNYFIVLGGRGLENRFEKLRFWLRNLEQKGCKIILLSDAASEWKRLTPFDLDVTTHWENHQLLRDANQIAYEELPLYSRNKGFVSAAGMMATADVVLNTIIEPYSTGLAHAVSRVLLMHAIRTHDTYQPRSENDSMLLQQAGLQHVIQLMEENLETPLSIKVLAEQSGCSIRQVERRFQKAIGCSPNAFYRSLRLKRGKALLQQTGMSITEIAVSLGFSSSSSFSRLYTREYGITPSRSRSPK